VVKSEKLINWYLEGLSMANFPEYSNWTEWRPENITDRIRLALSEGLHQDVDDSVLERTTSLDSGKYHVSEDTMNSMIILLSRSTELFEDNSKVIGDHSLSYAQGCDLAFELWKMNPEFKPKGLDANFVAHTIAVKRHYDYIVNHYERTGRLSAKDEKHMKIYDAFFKKVMGGSLREQPVDVETLGDLVDQVRETLIGKLPAFLQPAPNVVIPSIESVTYHDLIPWATPAPSINKYTRGVLDRIVKYLKQEDVVVVGRVDHVTARTKFSLTPAYVER
jgi:hypothetical protein